MSATDDADYDALDRAIVAGGPATRAEALRYDADRHVHAGIETRTDPPEYDWDGLRRGGRRDAPTVLLQYTLSGWGRFEQGGRAWRAGPGTLFAAVIPSAHRYHLPVESPRWRFFWFVLRHPYVIDRLSARVRECGPVLAAAPDSPLVARMVQLFHCVRRHAYPDALAWEAAVIDVMLEFERAADRARYPQNPRDRLLEQTRAEVVRSLRTGIDVSALAAMRGTSRSAFSHHFKATTGMTPAAYITELRLREASRRLLQTDDKLAAVAAATGFADANHLCKVFRRHYHMSPGQYRKHLR